MIHASLLYCKYSLTITESVSQSEFTFPKIRICGNSMHSRMKVEKLFPNISSSDLMGLYGQTQLNQNISVDMDRSGPLLTIFMCNKKILTTDD